jgi:hypothetical protein
LHGAFRLKQTDISQADAIMSECVKARHIAPFLRDAGKKGGKIFENNFHSR